MSFYNNKYKNVGIKYSVEDIGTISLPRDSCKYDNVNIKVCALDNLN